ncbi:MAG: hypothetical protein QXK76_01695 [Candidatus Woesearchaeota archaeon]
MNIINTMDAYKTHESIRLEVKSIAAAKQYVPLIREITNILPKKIIELTGSSFHSNLLLKELEFNNINANITYKEKKYLKNALSISLHYDNSPINGVQKLTFHIDPLKFEKRRLLSIDEILELKERYKIRNKEKIIFAGATHFSEYKIICPAIKNHLLKNKDSKAVIVPYTEGHLEDIARYLDFETNYSLKGNKKCLVIEEQGTLDKLYSLADIVLLGNTFKIDAYDGQNPLEPAFYGKPMLSGIDYHEWNKDAYIGLLKSGLLRRINPYNLEAELERNIPKKEIEKSRIKAEAFIKSRQGAAKVYANIIKKFINNTLSYKDKEYLSEKRTFSELKKLFIK